MQMCTCGFSSPLPFSTRSHAPLNTNPAARDTATICDTVTDDVVHLHESILRGRVDDAGNKATAYVTPGGVLRFDCGAVPSYWQEVDLTRLPDKVKRLIAGGEESEEEEEEEEEDEYKYNSFNKVIQDGIYSLSSTGNAGEDDSPIDGPSLSVGAVFTDNHSNVIDVLNNFLESGWQFIVQKPLLRDEYFLTGNYAHEELDQVRMCAYSSQTGGRPVDL